MALKRLNLDGGQGAARRPVASRRRPPAGTRRRSRRWMRRNVRTEVARDILRLAIIGVWAAEPRDVSLLHVLFYIRSAGSLEILTDTEGGAQQDRIVGGSQLISLRMAEQLGSTVVELCDPGPLGSPQRRRGHGRLRPGHGERQARDRRDPAHARRPDRLRPAAAGASRRALPADGPGKRGQVHGRLRAPVLARPRPLGRGDQRHRAGLGRLRQLAARRFARRPARVPRGPGGPRGGRPRRRGAARRSSPAASPASSAPRPPIRSTTSTGRGAPRSGREAVTAASCRPGPGPTTAPRCASRSGRSTGPAPRRRSMWNGYMDGAVGSGQEAARAAIAAVA